MNESIIQELVPQIERVLNSCMVTVFDLAQKFSVDTTDIIQILQILEANRPIKKLNIGGASYYTIMLLN